MVFEDSGIALKDSIGQVENRDRCVSYVVSGLPSGFSTWLLTIQMRPVSFSFYLLYSILFVGGVGLPQEGADFYARIHRYIYMFLLEFQWVEEFSLRLFISIYGVSPNGA